MKQLKLGVLFGCLTCLNTGCSSMTLQYSAELQTDKGQAHYTYEKTYGLQSAETWCWITAIFYGGSCWAYLGQPYENRERAIADDAQAELHSKYSVKTFEVRSERVERLSWNRTTKKSNFVLQAESVENKSSQFDINK